MLLVFVSSDEKYLEVLANPDADVFHSYLFLMKLFAALPYLPLVVWDGVFQDHLYLGHTQSIPF